MAAVDNARFILANINWSFGRSNAKLFDCRKHHWFPATFIPEIPYTLIEVLTKPGDTVFDPFGGIGTTFYQALLLGRHPYTIENSVVTVNLMRSMWTLFDPRTDLAPLDRELEELKVGFNPARKYERAVRDLPGGIEALRPWFHEQTFRQLVYIAAYQARRRSNAYMAAAQIAFSATLKAVTAQDEGWGCIADNMLPKPRQLKKQRDAIGRFARNMTVLARDVIATRGHLPKAAEHLLTSESAEARIIHGDVRVAATQIRDNSVDLIVTSPPYPSMTDYATSQRLSYYGLGADPMRDLSSEIGARRKRFSRNSIETYLSDMRSALERACSKVRAGGFACFVMPAFDGDKGKNSDRKQAVQGCFSNILANGFVLEQELTRILPTRRRHHNQGWTSLERETIFVYRKLR